MKAALIEKFGNVGSIKVTDIDAPKPHDQQHLVDVKYAGINPFDVNFVSGTYSHAEPSFPFTLGGDFSGVIQGTDEAVYGSAQRLAGNSGAFAEIAAVNNDSIAPKPKKATMEEAAALPLVGVSAIQALDEHINLKSGQKILIHGGAGGIGHIAIQIAKAIGAYVVTTVSKDDIEFVIELGADKVIEYKSEKFEKEVSELDAVFDTVGGETKEKSLQVIKKGGILVSMLGEANQETADKLKVITIGQSTKISTDRLNRLARYFDDGDIKIIISKIFDLQYIKDAYEAQGEKHRGKIILRISDTNPSSNI